MYESYILMRDVVQVAPELRQTLLEADSERTEGAAKPLDFEDKLKRMMEEVFVCLHLRRSLFCLMCVRVEK
jgi:hypothetical protein